MDPRNFIADSVAQPKDAIIHSISRRLRDEFPDAHLLETESQFFSVYRFHCEGQCQIQEKSDIHSQWEFDWDASDNRPTRNPYNTWLRVKWEEQELEVVTIGYFSQYCRNEWHCIVAPDRDLAQRFFNAVCAWNSQVRGEVLVCHGDRWYKSKDLFEDIRSSTFDDLVLENGLKEQLITDLTSFFESKETYERYGIAWKRGVLLLGPPGNGKTHAVKAILNLLKRPCIYVKSLSAQYSTDQDNIQRIFKRARELSPCFLIFEDLDSMLHDDNRAYFLNEMDGFASNGGILTIATTNHPERLDPAILDRPSRFDRKYNFALPGPQGRQMFLHMFAEKLDQELRLTPEAEVMIAEATDGYSYAYLRELYLSSMMRWISGGQASPMEELMLEQADLLKAQMATDPLSDIPSDGGRSNQTRKQMMQQMMNRQNRNRR
jgi:AAA+ superfamily predicted ATPase